MKKYLFLFILFFLEKANAQVCGTPGRDNNTNTTSVINTYYQTLNNDALYPQSTGVILDSVPSPDAFGNSFGNVPIKSGDLLLIIQTQDGRIDTTNSVLYGQGIANSGPDLQGGTGYKNLETAGYYEYIVAKNDVPLTGGTLYFKGGGINSRLKHSYINFDGNGIDTGKKSFQIIRIPQYSSLTLSTNVVCPPFNGKVGGIIAFDVAGDLDFNNHTVDASGKGFRGGFRNTSTNSCNNTALFKSDNPIDGSGKGEGLTSTPRFTWDGYNAVDSGINCLGCVGGSFAKGGSSIGGGGGNNQNAGGGGGGNGGAGGMGGNGNSTNCPNDFGTNTGGRPGINIANQTIDRLFFGGGGGGGNNNNNGTSPKGGCGGGIVLITANRIVSNGTILSNGKNGEIASSRSVPNFISDGAGGGGAGGTIKISSVNSSPSTVIINLFAEGGNGGNTINDQRNESGPGGGGGGGIIWFSIPGAIVNNSVSAGIKGATNNGNFPTSANGSQNGQIGLNTSFNISSIPTYLQGQSFSCFPLLTISKSELHAGFNGSRPPGNKATYIVTIRNNSNGGADGVKIHDLLPSGFVYLSNIVKYQSGAVGPSNPVNTGSNNDVTIGDFYLPPGGVVIDTIFVQIQNNVLPGVYQNGAQVLYSDPTRNLQQHSITPSVFSITGQDTTYQNGYYSGTTVSGLNYDTSAAGPIDENVQIIEPGQIPLYISKCEGDTATLGCVVPTYPFSTNLTYRWSGPSGFIDSISTPKVNNLNSSHSGFYKIIVTDDNGFNWTDSIKLIVNPFPATSILNLTSDPQCLSSNQYSFTSNTPTTGFQIDSYTWNFGDGSLLGNTAAYSHTYNAAGTYSVTLREVTDSGCIGNDILIVSVKPQLTTRISASGSLIFCEPGNLNLISSVSGVGNLLSYQWFNNNIAIPGANSPNYIVTQSGNYTLDLLSNNLCHDISNAQTVVVYPKPQGVLNSVSGSLHLCMGDRLALNVSGSNIFTYQWYYADTNNPLNSVRVGNNSPDYYATTPGFYSVELTTSTNPTCKAFAADTLNVSLVQKPIPAFTFPLVCAGTNILFTNNSDTTNSGDVYSIWNFGDSIQSYYDYNPTHNYQIGTNYPVSLQLIPKSCPSLDTTIIVTVPVDQTRPGIRYPTVNTTKFTNTPLQARNFASQYSWSPNIGLTNSNYNIPNPIFNYDREVDYVIELKTQAGCKTYDSVSVQIFAAQCIQVPTAFSPNRDGHNDFLDVFLTGPLVLKSFKVYNRWGKVLFETNDLNKKWDGTVRGLVQPPETYIWVAEALDDKGNTISKRGQFILLK